jgi:2-keto-4-pentenoate hydratase/2-oxohepta-3-ene-1,7-dioic acid hydratase in catechol pathway
VNRDDAGHGGKGEDQEQAVHETSGEGAATPNARFYEARRTGANTSAGPAFRERCKIGHLVMPTTPTRHARIPVVVAFVLALHGLALAQAPVTRYVRFTSQGIVAYGMLEGDTVRELAGDLFSDPAPTGRTYRRQEVQVLAPCDPAKVIAVGLNYRSHIGDRPVAPYPGLFAKLPSSIVGPGDDIVLPVDAENAHYEGELVIVIGKRAKNVPESSAGEHVFGVTAGNDVSERNWQRSDLQWFRAKASDTFGPLGPVIARGLDYDDLLVQTRVNGEVRQSERTKDLIFGVNRIVSYVSRYVTLEPGDVIYTGTPQTTQALKPGDVVEVEVEGVGVLRNTVTRARP